MKSNLKARPVARTYEGGPAVLRTTHQLERLVATTMLFENTFYESGDVQAKNIAEECARADVREIASVAIKAREVFKLRHVPLFLLAQLNKRRAECRKLFPSLLRDTVAKVVQRPDEAGELLSIISKEEGKPIKKVLSHGVEKGLKLALQKFNAYQLSKWNRDSAVKLKDVFRLIHAKPSAKEGPLGAGEVTDIVYKTGSRKAVRHTQGQAATYRALMSGTLESADTWEKALSAGADKKATWERLLSEKKLGYMALLMNLRNMVSAKVKASLVEKALLDGAKKSRALPFRFLSAERHAPQFSAVLSDAMLKAVEDQKGSLPGRTVILVDNSGSMYGPKISSKSELDRIDAACAVAILSKEICESSIVYTFTDHLQDVRNTKGIPLREAIRESGSGGTYLKRAMDSLAIKEPDADRLIIITDEESADGIGQSKYPLGTWIVNVASYKPVLIVSKNVRRIFGFSERILDFIKYEEGINVAPNEAE